MGGRRVRAPRARRTWCCSAPPGVDAGAAARRAGRRVPRDPPRPAEPRPAGQRARDRRARRPPRPSGSTDRLARGVVALANVVGQVRPRPGAGRSGACSAQRMIVVDSRWRTLRAGRAPGDARARDDAHGAGPGHVGPHAGVARRGRGDVRLRRRPLRGGAAARGRPAPATSARAELCGRNAIFGLSGSAAGRGVRRRLGARRRRSSRGSGTKGLFRLYDAFNDQAFRGRPGAATDRTACCAARSACRSRELDAAVAGGCLPS